MRLVFQGVLLFLFIPLVLFLYLRQPMGPGLSTLAGVAIMFGHRFVAGPWMARHSTERCLWCGRPIPLPVPSERTRVEGKTDRTQDTVTGQQRFRVVAGGVDQPVAACRPAHRDLAGRFLTFITRYRLPIAIGIFVPLVVLLVANLALAIGHPLFPQRWNTWQFKTVVALTVVLTSLAYRTVKHAEGSLRSPFPLHNLFLLGIRNTLWVFRAVGAWWLVAGLLEVWA